MVLSSGKFDKDQYLTGEEILPRDQRKVTEEAKIAYSPLGKAFEIQTKMITEQWEKQIKSIEEHEKQQTKSSVEKDSLELLALLRIGSFGTAQGWRGVGGGPICLKSIGHILQWWNLAQLYLS